MKIQVVVKPNSRREGVEPLADGSLRVSVNARPKDGEANDAVTRALAQHFGVAPSRVVLKLGRTAKKKVFEILE